MNYDKIYNQIIDKSKKERRKKKKGCYYEKHHIIPKCLGGLDNIDNITLLTAREHFICHRILHILNPNNFKLFMAFEMMCNVNDSKNQYRYTPSSRVIEYIKIEHSKRMSGENNIKYWKGKKRILPSVTQKTKNKISKSLKDHNVSEETKEKIRIKNKGKKPWNKDKKLQPLSEEHKRKISISNKNKIVSEETKEKLRIANKGQISWNKGRTTPEEVKIKIGKANKKRKVKYIKCLYCNREIPASNYYQWHGEKCKNKK